ncbi:MAG: FtsQ-type POTRA domain-containing protein, partial [Thermoanaerobaculia bacterium]
VLPFRRPAAAVRVRRRSPWAALGRPFLQAVAVVGLPALAASWALSSPAFALAGLELSGNRWVEDAWIRSALAPLHGENLLRLALADVERRVAAHPWVAAVTVEKRLPDRLRLILEERRPAGLLRSASGLVYLDRHGRPIAPLAGPEGPAGLLLVSMGTAAEVDLAGAFDVADELAAAAPGWADTLSEVAALGEDDYRLDLGALPFPLLVRRGTLAERLPALAALLPDLEGRYPRLAFVDLRAHRRIVFQPVVERS